MSSARQTLRILGVAAVLSLVWTVAVRLLPRPELAETNYEANRLRIERWLLDPAASNVVVGTSISGRLLPAYFSQTELKSFANLGLDGANPQTGLDLVLARDVAPKTVFLEIHRLTQRPGTNDQQLLDFARGPSLAASRYAPLTRADRRPSTVLYGWLKSHQTGGSASGTMTNAVNNLTAGESPDLDWPNRLASRLAALRARGTRVVLLRLPVGRENPADADGPNFGDEASVRLHLPLIDLYRATQHSGVSISYTDGLHLTPGSAAKIAELLVQVPALEPTR